jgi:betaine-aldehyde dehydrogenase
MRDGLYIGGRWEKPAAGGTFEVVDPATEQPIAKVAAATAADVDRAVTAAAAALPAWKRTSGAERAVILRAIAEGIRARRDELAAIEVADNGKPLPEAKWDIDDTAGCFEFYAGLAEELDGRQEQPVAVGDPRFTSKVRREAVGVAGAIIPWNYPMLMAAWKVAPALAAGCTMVLKP